MSIDAREDDVDDDLCCDCGGREGVAGRPHEQRYELFVRAKWTSATDAGARRSLVPPAQFVQTFRVRRLGVPGYGRAAPLTDRRQLLNTEDTEDVGEDNVRGG